MSQQHFSVRCIPLFYALARSVCVFLCICLYPRGFQLDCCFSCFFILLVCSLALSLVQLFASFDVIFFFLLGCGCCYCCFGFSFYFLSLHICNLCRRSDICICIYVMGAGKLAFHKSFCSNICIDILFYFFLQFYLPFSNATLAMLFCSLTLKIDLQIWTTPTSIRWCLLLLRLFWIIFGVSFHSYSWC